MQATNLTQAIMKASLMGVNASKPCNAVIGTVVSEEPLKIKISQKLTLTDDFFRLCSNVKEKTVETELGVSIKIQDGLAVGEDVLMLQEAGGQMYYVIDRLE